MKRIIILSAIFALLFSVFNQVVIAEPVGSMKAEQVAQHFFTSKFEVSEKLKTRGSITFQDKTPYVVGQDTLFYIFNLEAEGGFILVSGDERAYPIIAFSPSGQFPLESTQQSPALQQWMHQYVTELKDIIINNTPAEEKIQQRWNYYSVPHQTTANRSGVEPLLSSTWSQGLYYNTMCPEDVNGIDGHTPVGCVATAMAQVMYYHQFPGTGEGYYEYYHPVYGSLSADFSGTTYNWAAMPDQAIGYNDALAIISYHCGVSVDMDYGPNGSGASTQKVADALVDYFRYAPTTNFQCKENYSNEAWNNLLKDELDNNRPMVYRGQDSIQNVGHAFVCDGYDNTSYDNYFHFNWGWNGSGNGYYYLDNLNVGGYDWSNYQCAIYGIEPEMNSQALVSFNVDMSEFAASEFNPSVDEVFLTGNPFGWTTPGADPLLEMTDPDGDLVYSLDTTLPNGHHEYKYFYIPEGSDPTWSYGEWNGDPNRFVEVNGQEILLDEIWGGFLAEFHVTNESSQDIEGATINISDQLLTTGASGYASTVLVPDSTQPYGYQVLKDGYPDMSGDVWVDFQDVMTEVMMSSMEFFTVTFFVSDGTDPLENATITLPDTVLVTDSVGLAAVELPNGEYPYTTTSEGFAEVYGEVIVYDDDVIENVVLSEGALVTFNVDMSGIANQEFNPETDEVFITGVPFEWATPGSDASLQMGDPDDDMIYTLDTILSPGGYDYKYFYVPEGSDPTWNYGEWDGGSNRFIEVPEENITADDIWGAFMVEFHVVNSQEEAVEGAVITINGQELITDVDGMAVTALPPTEYEPYFYEVTADGYLDMGGDLWVDFQDVMTEVMMSPMEFFTVTFFVSDGTVPLENATITLPDTVLVTDSVGLAAVELPNGEYPYTTTSEGFAEVYGEVIVYDDDVIENVVLSEGALVTFNVDMSGIANQEFNPETDEVFITGGPFGWATPGSDASLQMGDPDDDMIYTLDTILSPGGYDYKYFYVPDGVGSSWNYGEWQGTNNRTIDVEFEDVTTDDVWGRFMVIFHVMNQQNEDIPGATININQQELITDNNGVAEIYLQPSVDPQEPFAVYEYLVEAFSYQLYDGTLTMDYQDFTEEVFLEEIILNTPYNVTATDLTTSAKITWQQQMPDSNMFAFKHEVDSQGPDHYKVYRLFEDENNPENIIHNTFEIENDFEGWQPYSVVGDETWLWQQYDNGCLTMTGYDGASQENLNYLISPALDCSSFTELTLTFREAINYEGDVTSNEKVLVSTNYAGTGDPAEAFWYEMEVTGRPQGNSWTFVDVGPVDLSAFAGEGQVYIAFLYNSTTANAGTWEIGEVKVTGNDGWVLLSDAVSDTVYFDEGWPALVSGNYQYGVQADYLTGMSSLAKSNILQKGENSHFTPVWTGNAFQPMTFMVGGASLEEVPLEAGDEVGIFDGELCVGAGVLTSTLDAGNDEDYIIIIASKDDGGGNGYSEGNAISYKLWDSSEELELEVTQVEFPLYPEFTYELFTALETNFVNLLAATSYSQQINYQAGWNMTSFAVEPEDNNMQTILQPLIDNDHLLKVIDEQGNIIEQMPWGWVNNIGAMSLTEGYYLKLSADDSISVEGELANLPYDIPLTSGWNMIGYPAMDAQNASDVFANLMSNNTLIKVIDEQGNIIEEMPWGWVDNIGTMQAGEGYYVKVSSDAVLTIEEPAGSGLELKPNYKTPLAKHFTPVYQGNPYEPMQVVIDASSLNLKQEDELAIYSNGKCVGAAGYNPKSSHQYLTASKADSQTAEQDGYLEGTSVILKVYRKADHTVYHVPYEQIEGPSGYEPLQTKIVKATSLTTGVDNEQAQSVILYQNKPNPLKDKTIISYYLPESGEVSLSIVNLQGQVQMKLVEQIQKSGLHQIELEGNSLSPGIYLYQLNYKSYQGKQQQLYKKMTIVR